MSAERVAIEVAGPVIDRSTTWLELHEALACNGIQYRAKGSGAVLAIGAEAVKAGEVPKSSPASRNKAPGTVRGINGAPFPQIGGAGPGHYVYNRCGAQTSKGG